MVVGSVVGVGFVLAAGAPSEEGREMMGASIRAETGKSRIGSAVLGGASAEAGDGSLSPGTSRNAVVPAILLDVFKKISFLATKSVSQPTCTIPTRFPPKSEIAMTPSDVDRPETFSAFLVVDADEDESR
jgi:hypothetical protein